MKPKVKINDELNQSIKDSVDIVPQFMIELDLKLGEDSIASTEHVWKLMNELFYLCQRDILLIDDLDRTQKRIEYRIDKISKDSGFKTMVEVCSYYLDFFQYLIDKSIELEEYESTANLNHIYKKIQIHNE